MTHVDESSVPKYPYYYRNIVIRTLRFLCSETFRHAARNVITAGRYRVHGAKIDIYLSQGGRQGRMRDKGEDGGGGRGIKQSGGWVLCPGDYIQRKPFPPRAPPSPSGFGSERARNGAHPVGCSDGFPPLPVGGRLFEL